MNKIIILLLSVLALTGCDNYNDRTEVLPEITANHKSLTIFIGGEAQIVASPQDGTSFTWTSASPDVATVSEDGLVKALSEGSSDITVRKGDAFIIISVIVIPKIPLTNIELSTYDVKMKIGDHSIVQIVSTPTEANDIPMNDFWWWSDDETIATVNAEGEITGMSLGSTQIHYRRGDLVRTVDVSVLFFLSNSTPFMGPHILSQATPLTLWACNFDFGGEGVGFHDGDTNNQGNFAYRANNGDPNSPGVDIENGNGNPNGIGYTAAGEWLIYTVEVEDAGIYSFQLEGAGTGTSSFYLEVDGVNQTGNISFSSTGGWSNWAWAYTNNSVELNLSEGTHWIKFYFVSAASNIRAYKFTYLRPN